jgi:4-hydroxy-tetrahydrodipicolinate reductase
MGLAVAEATMVNPDTVIAATHDAGEDLDAVLQTAKCVIDFTVHSFSTTLVEAVLRHRVPIVMGTTTITAPASRLVRKLARDGVMAGTALWLDSWRDPRQWWRLPTLGAQLLRAL